MRGHEDYGNGSAHCSQPTPHLNPRYTAQMNVDDNTRYIACAIATKKCLSASEYFRGKARRIQHPLEPAQDARIVIDDRHYLAFCCQFTVSAICGLERKEVKFYSRIARDVNIVLWYSSDCYYPIALSNRCLLFG